ncbi:MAG: hypothetical protein GQ535_17520 [Rhodobacteraceae bacterium]|nr:hypothetical protein [Paracoccaceae bacterium]
MFGLGSPSAKKLAGRIARQIVGFQSVMFRLSYEQLDIPKRDISKIEITYYSMSLVSLSVLFLSKYKNKLKAVEQAQLDVLKASLANSGSELNLDAAISQYQTRFSQYKNVFDDLVNGDLREPEMILATLFTNNVSQGKSAMPDYLAAHSIFAQGVNDNLDFAKNML